MTVRRCAIKSLALLITALCVGTPAQEGEKRANSPLEKMMELNRSGEWEQSARLAQSFLEPGKRKPLLERCEAFYHLAYAQTKLERVANAKATLKAYNRECRKLPHTHWAVAESARLVKELAARGVPTTPKEDGFWRRSDPAALGMNVQALNAHRELCLRTGADACLVIRGGKIVQEAYSVNYREPMLAMSSTKSIAGLLVGMLIDDGKIKSVDEPVCSFIKEWCGGVRGEVTLRHLLTMTSGLPRTETESVGLVADKNAYVIALTPTSKPGTKWQYSNEGVQLLSPVLDAAAGEPIQDYARRRLFEPLGMLETRLHIDVKGHAWTYADMETTPRDFARIGLLMLGKGVWQGKRILSEEWIERSTKPSQSLEPKYGFLWWLYEKPKGYAAIGHLDTDLFVFPDKDLLVVRMQSKPVGRAAPYEYEALQLFDQFVRP